MDQNTEILVELGASLTNLAFKGTVSAISAKIKIIKAEKNAENVKNKYDEIVNELIAEREEAIRIAQIYKSEIEKIEISDADIEHLQHTISSVLEIVEIMSPDINTKQYEPFKKIFNTDTLKAMQLLGFNYKSAIGEPLTNLCANFITSINKNQNKSQNKKFNSK